MESPGSGDLRLGLIFYSSADLLHSLDVDVRLHFRALPVDGLKERALRSTMHVVKGAFQLVKT